MTSTTCTNHINELLSVIDTDLAAHTPPIQALISKLSKEGTLINAPPQTEAPRNKSGDTNSLKRDSLLLHTKLGYNTSNGEEKAANWCSLE